MSAYGCAIAVQAKGATQIGGGRAHFCGVCVCSGSSQDALGLCCAQHRLRMVCGGASGQKTCSDRSKVLCRARAPAAAWAHPSARGMS